MTELKVTETNANEMGFELVGMGFKSGDAKILSAVNPDTNPNGGGNAGNNFTSVSVGEGTYNVKKIFIPNNPVFAVPAPDIENQHGKEETEIAGTEQAD